MSSELIVMTFPFRHKAETVLAAIRVMRKSPILCLGSVAVATKDATGEATLRPGEEPAGVQENRDTALLLSLAGLILGDPAQEAVDAIVAGGLDRQFMSEVARRMAGESSALFVLAREDGVHDAGETRGALALFRGTIHQTRLPPEAEEYLLAMSPDSWSKRQGKETTKERKQ
jgi:uncharacterized membrane protein